MEQLPSLPPSFGIAGYNTICQSVADTWPNIGGGGQAYCFGRMTSHISIVLEQKNIVFQNIGGAIAPLAPPVSATDANTI